MGGQVNSPTKPTLNNAEDTSLELNANRAAGVPEITRVETEKRKGFWGSLLSRLFPRPTNEGAERIVIDDLYRHLLEQGRLRIADLQADPKLMEAATLYLQENYPHLINPALTQEFLKRNSDEIDRLIAASYTERIERALNERRISVAELMDPTVMEVTTAYIAKHYPHLAISRSSVMQRTEHLLRELEAEQNRSNDAPQPDGVVVGQAQEDYAS